MSWCGWVCDTVEDAVDEVVDTLEGIVEDIVDAVEDAVETVVEFVEDAAEWVADVASDVGEFVAGVAAGVWDWITETGSAVWDWIKQAAGDVWDWTTGTLDEAWDWVKETASDAWNWVSDAAESVWDGIVSAAEAVKGFVQDKVVPFLLDALWVITHIDDFIAAGVFGLACLLTEQDEKEYDVVEGLFRLDEDALGERSVAFLPQDQRYVIVSDIHLFVAGDPLDKFRQLDNHQLYQAVLGSYAAAGYTLIENGDIEDLWMRETTLAASIMDEVFVHLGWPFGDLLEADYEDARIRSQAVKIFDNNADVYETIRNLFHDSGRFIRLVGNHDDYWRSDEYLPALQMVYPGLDVFDYAFIGDYGADRHSHGGVSPRAIVAHGHQVDAWNNSMCRAAGEAITAAVSGIPSLAAGVTPRSEWEPKLAGLGFHNELDESLFAIDEVEFYETIEDGFSNHPYVPHFILGHTHAPRRDAQIPEWMFRDEWNFREYTNEGTAGRWEQLIWCATVTGGQPALHGWTRTPEGRLRRHTFQGGYADYLRAA